MELGGGGVTLNGYHTGRILTKTTIHVREKAYSNCKTGSITLSTVNKNYVYRELTITVNRVAINLSRDG